MRETNKPMEEWAVWRSRENEIDALTKLGEQFVFEYRTSPFREQCIENGYLTVAADNAVLNGKKGLSIDVTSSIHSHEDPEQAEVPLFVKESISETTTTGVSSEVVNSSQMHIPGLIITASGLLSGEIKAPKDFREKFTSRLGALFFNEANIGDFLTQAKSQKMVSPTVNGEKPTNFMIMPDSFYALMAKGYIPATDIHDVVHHSLQRMIWPEEFGLLYDIAHSASELKKKVADRPITERGNVNRFNAAVNYVSMAMAEYSLVGSDVENLFSFGCIPWQSPRKSPVEKVDHQNEHISANEFNKWSGLRILMSLKRRELEASEKNGKANLNWFGALGYSTDPSYMPSRNPDGTFGEPVAQLERDHEVNLGKLQVPESPEELFYNSIQLLKSEKELLGDLADSINLN